jgi:hypothetical protein
VITGSLIASFVAINQQRKLNNANIRPWISIYPKRERHSLDRTKDLISITHFKKNSGKSPAFNVRTYPHLSVKADETPDTQKESGNVFIFPSQAPIIWPKDLPNPLKDADRYKQLYLHLWIRYDDPEGHTNYLRARWKSYKKSGNWEAGIEFFFIYDYADQKPFGEPYPARAG